MSQFESKDKILTLSKTSKSGSNSKKSSWQFFGWDGTSQVPQPTLRFKSVGESD